MHKLTLEQIRDFYFSNRFQTLHWDNMRVLGRGIDIPLSECIGDILNRVVVEVTDHCVHIV